METNKRADGDWVKTLSGIEVTRANEPEGEGWKTTKELREIYKCGTCRLYEIINKGVAEGKIDQFHGSGQNASGRIVRRVWYKLK